MDAIPLIMPCLNRFDMFTEAIETVDTPILPIVIDQWRGNRGVSGAWNEGMKRVLNSNMRYAIVSNDDVKFAPGAMRKIYNTLVETGAALVSPTQRRRPLQLTGVDHDTLREGADFFCFAIDCEQIVSSAGWFDQNIFPAYFEDNDMHRRMLLSGLTSYIHEGCEVFHEGSKTQNLHRSKPVTDNMAFEENKAYYKLKWGDYPGKEYYKTPFNHPELTVRDWNGSMLLDEFEATTSAQKIFDLNNWQVGEVAPQISFETI